MTNVAPIFDCDSKYELRSFNGVDFILRDDIKICFIYSDDESYAQELAHLVSDRAKGKTEVMNMVNPLSRAIGGVGINNIKQYCDTRYDSIIFQKVSALLKEDWFVDPNTRLIIYGPYVRYIIADTLREKFWEDSDSVAYMINNYAFIATKPKSIVKRIYKYMFNSDPYEDRLYAFIDHASYNKFIHICG